MSLRLQVLDQISVPSGKVNDDRVGAAGALAWAIDGATDVLAEPLMPGGSDAAWIAAMLDNELTSRGTTPVASLDALVAELTEAAARAFAREQRRPPSDPHEYPSAAGFIVRLADGQLDYLALADCQCFAAAPGEPVVELGHDPRVRISDKPVIEVMQTYRAETQGAGWREARQHFKPRFRAARARLNTPDGYGVLSVIPVPPQFPRTGRHPVEKGTRVLLATDGFMRISDMFGRYATADLIDVCCNVGLAAVAEELREMERADGDCVHVPRTKPHDDASAILLEVVA